MVKRYHKHNFSFTHYPLNFSSDIVYISDHSVGCKIQPNFS